MGDIIFIMLDKANLPVALGEILSPSSEALFSKYPWKDRSDRGQSEHPFQEAKKRETHRDSLDAAYTPLVSVRSWLPVHLVMST